MQTIKYIVGIAIMLLCGTTHAQQNTFEINYNTGGEDEVYHAIEVGNSFFFSCANTDVNEPYYGKAYILKTDKNGGNHQILRLNQNNFGIISSITTKPNGNILCIGNVKDSLKTNSKVRTVEIDTNLNIISDKRFGDPQLSYSIRKPKKMRNGNIIALAEMFLLSGKFFAFTINLNGDSVNAWQYNAITPDDIIMPCDIMQMPASDKYYIAKTLGDNFGPHSSILVINPVTGAVENKHYLTVGQTPIVSLNFEMFRNIDLKPMDNTTFLAVGRVYNKRDFLPDPYYGAIDMVISKWDTAFNVLKYVLVGTRDFKEVEGITSMDFKNKNNIYLANSHKVSTRYSSDTSYYMVTNFDDTLGIRWQRFYTNNNYLFFYHLLATNDGGALVCGSSHNWRISTATNIDRDLYIIKLDSLGNSSVSSPALLPPTEYRAYPNPLHAGTSDQFNIELGNPHTPHTLTMYNALGCTIYTAPMRTYPQNIIINTHALPAGIYTYRITDANHRTAHGKMIKY